MPLSLLDKLAMGDESTFEQVYELYREPFVKWVLHKYGVDEDEAIDIFQDAVISLYENALGGRLKNESGLKSYLFVIGRNILINRLKKNKRMVSTDAFPHLRNTVLHQELIAYEEVSEETLKVSKLLLQLGEPCKSILEYYYFHNWSMEDIALRLEYNSPDVAKTQKSRCVKRFRRMMETIDNRQWTMDNGQWTMDNGQWTMDNRQ